MILTQFKYAFLLQAQGPRFWGKGELIRLRDWYLQDWYLLYRPQKEEKQSRPR